MRAFIEKLIGENENLKEINLSSISNDIAKDTVIIVIDMVKGFCTEGILSSNRANSIVDSILNLLNNMKDSNKIFFLDSHTKDSVELNSYPNHCILGTIEEELIEELKDFCKYDNKSVFIKKNSINGFHTDEFKNWLKNNNNIKNFIVVGVCTDICVETFVISLKTYFNEYNINKNIYVPVNCIETFDSENHNANIMNIISINKMKSNGINVVKKIEG